MERAAVVLPAKDTGTGVFTGLWKMPTTVRERVAVVVFTPGSSGLGLRRLANGGNGWQSRHCQRIWIRLPCPTG